MLLCFVFRCSIVTVKLLVIMGGQHDGVLLSGSPPIVYILYAYVYFSCQMNSAAAAEPVCHYVSSQVIIILVATNVA